MKKRVDLRWGIICDYKEECTIRKYMIEFCPKRQSVCEDFLDFILEEFEYESRGAYFRDVERRARQLVS